MATKKINSEAETWDDEMPVAQDEKGNRIADEDIIGAGTAPQLLEFRAAGQNHKVFLLMSGISLDVRQAPEIWLRRHYLDQGVTGDEDVAGDSEVAHRIEQIEREAMLHPERQKLRAEIAVAAIARTSGGRFRISIPQFQDGLTAQKLCDDEIFGKRVVAEICGAVSGFFTR